MNSLGFVILLILFSSNLKAEWMVDFSRRQKDLVELEKQQEIYKEEKKTVLDMVTDRESPVQDLVIINTQKGFHPQLVQIKQNQRYRVHLVNVNKENKNVSFMMDAFSQHHGTYFGEEVVFEIQPRKEGLFHFQCPETDAKGQVVVYSSDSPVESPLESIQIRRPAAE